MTPQQAYAMFVEENGGVPEKEDMIVDSENNTLWIFVPPIQVLSIWAPEYNLASMSREELMQLVTDNFKQE
jgi:hypothetical protein